VRDFSPYFFPVYFFRTYFIFFSHTFFFVLFSRTFSKVATVTSLPVKHAQWSDPLDPPQILLENLLYTTHLKLTLTINSRNCDDSCHLQLTVGLLLFTAGEI
jgi:hypothetical protein